MKILFWIFFLITGLRHGIGGDTYQFRIFWDLLPSLDKVTWEELNSFRYDKGWVLLCFIIKSIFGSFVFLQLFISYVFNKGLFKIVEKYSNYPFFVILLFFISGEQYYHIECTFLRQCLAVGIFLNWGVEYLERRNYFKYTIVVIFCTLCHFSGLVIAFFPFVWYLDLKDKYVMKKVLLSFVVLAVLVVIIMNTSVMGEIRALARFADSFENMDNLVESNELIRFINSAHYNLFFLFFVFIGLIKYKIDNHFQGAVIILLFVCALAPYIGDLGRIQYYIIIFIDIFIAELFVFFTKKNKANLLIFISIYIVCTNLLIYRRYSDPNHSFMLYPYYCWFEEEPRSHKLYMNERYSDGYTISHQIYNWEKYR